jgi:hypothetical protein
MHAVLFSRHPLLDCLFRVVACILLILSAFAGIKLLMYIGIGMLVGLPMTYRVARVVYRLRKSGFDAHSPDSRTVPVETARVLHDELRQVLPAKTTVKATAQLTLNAFELLNAKPPGVFASLALVGLHGFSFIAGIVVLLGLMASQSDRFKELLNRFAGPQHPVEVSKVLLWEGADSREAGKKGVNTIIANFPKPEEAEKSYRNLTAKLPPQASATLFGQTVLVTLPAKDDDAREKWFNELETQCKSVFLHQPDALVSFALSCSGPNEDATKRLADEATEYLDLSSDMHAIAPWSPEQQITDQDRKARRTYMAIRDKGNFYEDPRWVSLNEKIMKNRRRGDKKAAAKLTEERQQLMELIGKEHLQQMRNEGEAKWDIALLDRYEKSPEPEFTGIADDDENDGNGPDAEVNNAEADTEKQQKKMDQWRKERKKWASEFGSHLGQLPMEGETPAAGSNRYSVQYGTAIVVDSILHISVSFERPADGAPALIKWLSQHGCTKMKYDFQVGIEDD